ncbi:PhzF family phenazine biosynthesis protein [Micromonospora harpali]|uniref:Phenazine biosynthesis protein PhzF n=2 Tax=Micromonospora TaxID=1873 RepID=A0A0D0X231_9ACTN|nr:MULTISPECIES: PhzF family phenazine biosynthesis protein [Micromonospora]KIR64979.1 phenazine biosynthesis protein PhzF [Micromonospora haikouensis]MDI5937908.1 PhzF family phenazine biosynthesis protein [Micromonospora sp. DH15]OON32407.1 phenazine biosynthesis protein PhzF [Micromonospora sp. Rc5]
MSTLAYEIVDVFTDRPFAGNPLAVVFGAEGLATEQMQSLALEFNLSETVFVLPPTQVGATYRARIFTPTDELPFAGHPSVGAAVTASRRGLFGVGQITQECGAGVLPIEVTAHGATLTGGVPTLGPELDLEPLLEMAGLTAADHAGPPPRVAGCGLEFPYLPVRPDAVARARVDPAAAQRYGLEHISVFSWDADSQTAHARVFVPGHGVPEDPATGSAALGLGVWLVASGLLPGEGRSSYTVRQGAELRRPSLLACTVTAAGGAAVGATVRGDVMPVARGEIAVPPFVG